MSQRLALPVAEWPESDRESWRQAQEPAGFLEPDHPASRWTPPTRSLVKRGYGGWLAWLDRGGMLEPSAGPGERITEDRLRDYVAVLQARLAPATVAIEIGALLRMLTVLEPDGDRTLLARLHRHLKQTAQPSRDKLSHLVPAAELFELGLRLMATCGDGSSPAMASQFRSGLIIALLICAPMRLKNLERLEIGQHLVFDGHGYRIELTAAETKTGRPYRATLPAELTPCIDRYLKEWRPLLSLMSPGGSAGRWLWLDQYGRPMSRKAIRRHIASRTENAFGKHVWPHLFRDCAVTELVDSAPEEIGLAPDLLGHARLETTRKHYIQATGMTAHLRVQEIIAARRRAAHSRTNRSEDTADD